MNNQELRAIADAVSNALMSSRQLNEDKAKSLAEAITRGIAEGTVDSHQENSILDDLMYYLQPGVNPYYNKDE